MGTWPCGTVVMVGELFGAESKAQVYGNICSAQSENLHNLEIALRILRIPRLRCAFSESRDCALQLHDLKIAHYSCAISRLRNTLARSRDCATIARNLLPQRACAETLSWL